jgi:macrolide transport system ATP-binding/permease protein
MACKLEKKSMSMTKPVLDISQLERHYQMGDTTVKALAGLDLKVEQGDFIMIVGGSGSGKSTLMHLIGLLDLPTQGKFVVNGQDTSKLDDSSLSMTRNRHIGFIFQQFNLLSNISVIQNIALPLSYRGVPKEKRLIQARKYACMIGLSERLNHTPAELSGGQMQRVAIARALASEPNILLADEPTGNLDSNTSAEIMDILYNLNAKGHTIIMVTHDIHLANQGTRKVTIKDGKILSDEPGVRMIENHENQSPYNPNQEVNPGLSFRDLLRIGIREGLLAHKMRTFLTMLGIIIGVSSVIAMSSFSLGSKQKQANQIRALGANLVKIVDKGLEAEKLSEARKSGSIGLNQADILAIRQNIEGIQAIATVRSVKMNILNESIPLNGRILGVGGDYLLVNNLTLEIGRNFDYLDQAKSEAVIVVGSRIASSFRKPQSALGKTLVLGGTPYQIIGILKDKNLDWNELEATSQADPNYDILMPLNTLKTRTTNKEMRSDFDEIQLQLKDEEDWIRVGKDLKRILAITHNLVEDYDLLIPMELLKQKQQSQKLLDVLTFCISTISILVGGIGIMNIMLASVTERIREIGIRRAVGATKKDILLQFLTESVTISVAGGILGILLSVIGIVFICSLLDLPIVFSKILFIISAGASTIIGLIFGIYPAWTAADKNPVEALRNE